YSPEEAMAEARRALAAGFDLEAAQQACPFKVDIPAFVRQLAEGDVDGARATIGQAHPFPSIFGRMCHWFCERGTPSLLDVGVQDPSWKPPVWRLAPHPDAILAREPQTRGESAQQLRGMGVGGTGDGIEKPNLL